MAADASTAGIRGDGKTASFRTSDTNKKIESSTCSSVMALFRGCRKYYKTTILLSFFAAIEAAMQIVLLFMPSTFKPQTSVLQASSAILSHHCQLDAVLDNISRQLETKCAAYSDGAMPDYELPPIHEHLMKGIARYACNLPQQEGLLSWGPDDGGQHKSLAELQRIWQTQGRLVVDIDMLDFNGDINDLNELLSVAVVQSFSQTKLSWRSKMALLEVLDREPAELHSKDDATNLWTILHTVLKSSASVILYIMELGSYFPYIGSTIQEAAEQFYGHRLASLDLFLKSILFPQCSIVDKITLKTLLPALNILGLSDPALGPVVTLIHLDSVTLAEGDTGQAALQQIMEAVSQHEFQVNLVPIIAVSTNTMWLYMSTSIPHFKSLFLPYEVQQLKEQEARHLLVNKMHAWSKQEFDFLWESVGGYYGSLSLVYKYQRTFNETVEEAVTRQMDYQFDTLSNVVHSWKGGSENMPPQELLEIVKQNNYHYSIASASRSVTAAANYLLKWNIMYIDSSLHLQPISKSMKVAIDKFY